MLSSQAKLSPSFPPNAVPLGPGIGPFPSCWSCVLNFNLAVTFGYLNSFISKSACAADRPLPLVPKPPLKEQGQMQPPLPLVGKIIEQKGTGAGTWHMQSIVPTVAALGT